MPYVKFKDADQPAFLHSIISTFIICCLEASIAGWLFESYFAAHLQIQVFSCYGSFLPSWWILQTDEQFKQEENENSIPSDILIQLQAYCHP